MDVGGSVSWGGRRVFVSDDVDVPAARQIPEPGEDARSETPRGWTSSGAEAVSDDMGGSVATLPDEKGVKPLGRESRETGERLRHILGSCAAVTRTNEGLRVCVDNDVPELKPPRDGRRRGLEGADGLPESRRRVKDGGG
jgi:hypothetical protein